MENIEYVLPGEIEKRSFAIIGEELKERGIVLPPEQEPVTKRVIHTSADFDYAKTMTYSPHAVQIAKDGACRHQQKTVRGIWRNGALFYGR